MSPSPDPNAASPAPAPSAPRAGLRPSLMLQEQSFWIPARGPFRPDGAGWHWQPDRLERHQRAVMDGAQRNFIKLHFFDLYSLAYSMVTPDEGRSGFAWRFEQGRQVTPARDPFTIFSVQFRPGVTIANLIYDRQGRAIAQVDFAPHGRSRSGHWHPLLPGSFFHLAHYPWESCPVLWSLVPKQAGRPRYRVGLRTRED